MFVTEQLLYGTRGKRKGKEDDRASVTSYNIRCEGKGYKECVLKDVECVWEVKG
jgi:hypothetical protein